MTGEKCEHCKVGWYVVYSTSTKGGKRTQYFHCHVCGNRPEKNKVVTSLSGKPTCRQRRRSRKIKSEG